MRRSSFYILIMGLLIVVALFSSFWFPNPAISQSNQSPTSMFPITMYGEEPFRVVGEIGRALPRRIVYDATSEQFAIVDVYNRLLLMDAHTYQTRYVLHSDQESDETNIAAMQFSHDGRYLAVINDLDVELWDTQTGTLAATLASPGSPRYLHGPLAFSSQDEVLVFYGVYPAPPALRRSENDVVVYPWVWHLPAARGERASTFPGGNAAQIMYDYRSGFALTPNDHILASLPSRLVVMDALTLEPLYEIPTQSYANDALQVWTSVKDGKVYVLTGASNVLLQIDTANRTVSEFPLYVRLSGSLRLSIQEIATPIARGALWRAFLDERQVAAAREVSLIDVVQPLDPASGGTRALLYVRTGSQHELRFSSGTYAISQMTLSPDGATLLTRESRSNGEVIAAYDIASGNQRDTLIPSLRSPNAYDRAGQNRALAYDSTGETFLSDFQRYDADTFEVLAEDLRYSFRYDRFFFGRDPGTMVTISGREWRVWDVATNSVLRREHLVHEASNIRAISPDAYRILYMVEDGAVVQDFDADEVYRIPFPRFETYGLSRADSVLNSPWTRMLSIYGDSASGMYGNGAVALTERDDSMPRWLIAGDDLPTGGIRNYGWIDDDTAYVSADGGLDPFPARIFGVEYAPSGIPACLAERFPEQEEQLRQLWERRWYFVRSDRLHQLALDLCAASSLPVESIMATVAVTRTPTPPYIRNATVTPTPLNATPVPPGTPPDCLFDLYPNPAERDAYTTLWREMSAAVPPEARDELTALLCEGVITVIERGSTSTGGEAASAQTMWIDAETGVRSYGSLPPTPTPSPNRLDLIAPIFAEVMERPLGTAILSDDHQMLAVSNLPGELTIYQLGFPYERAGLPFTATANAISTRQNLIYPNVTQGAILPTETPVLVGTARPTLTITPSQTIYPLPSEQVAYDQDFVCPARRLYTPNNLPENYSPTGRLYVFFGDSGVWAVEPENGQRFEDETAPLCGFGLNCQFSPDRAWILAQTYELVYVVRPDNSDQRILWDLRTPNPPTPFPQNLRWAAPDVLEWDAVITVGATPTVVPVIARDVLNVYPDPPVVEQNASLRVNGIPASLIARQPGGEWVVVEVPYGTGTGTGYRYYLYHLGTNETVFFAQSPSYQAQFTWHPYGQRLYFFFVDGSLESPRYEVVFPEVELHRARLSSSADGGVWSPDGKFRALVQGTSLSVYNAETGAIRRYCIPNFAGLSRSELRWSPDSRYIAFVADLINDEEEHLLVLDTETGAVVDLVRGIYRLITWGAEPGSYGTGAVVTPTPTVVPSVVGGGS